MEKTKAPRKKAVEKIADGLKDVKAGRTTARRKTAKKPAGPRFALPRVSPRMRELNASLLNTTMLAKEPWVARL